MIKPLQIAILASIWAQNLGDELIVKNEVKLLEQEFPGSCFRIFSYDLKHSFFVQENIRYIEYFPIDSKKIKNLFRNLKNFCAFLGTLLWSDVVVIGGGGIIYDSEIQSVRNPLDQWVFRAKCARFFRKKLYFYALGIDIKQEENMKKLELIFKNAWKVTVRDIKSWEQLKKIGLESEIVDDPVMSEAKQRWNILAIHSSRAFPLKEFENYDIWGLKIGLALRSWYIGKSQDARIERLLVEELCQYIEKRGSKVIFLPHSFHPTDIQANDFTFMKQFLKLGREICGNMQEVYEVYQHHLVDCVISMRLHSIILSHVYGIDQIVLSYSQKTEELLKKLDK